MRTSPYAQQFLVILPINEKRTLVYLSTDAIHGDVACRVDVLFRWQREVHPMQIPVVYRHSLPC